MTFSELLNKRRDELGLSIADISARLALSGYPVAKSTVGCWATGERNPQLNKPTVRRVIASVLQMDSNTMMQALGYVVLDDDHSPEGRQAAEIIDGLPDDMRRLAVDMVRTLQRVGG